MFCAISGHTPDVPVASRKTGHVFEKGLVEKYVESTGKCPVTGEELTLDDLLPLQNSTVVKPRPPSATSIPGMLSLLHAEWDALMLESFELKAQLETARKELAHALYQHDAACRVIARLTQERDEARRALETAPPGAIAADAAGHPAKRTRTGDAAAAAVTGGAPQPAAQPAAAAGLAGALPPSTIEEFEATAKRLSKGRKKRPPPASCATPAAVGAYTQLGATAPQALGAGATLTAMDVAAAGAGLAPPGAQGSAGWSVCAAIGASDGTVALVNAATGASASFAAAGAHGGAVRDVLVHRSRALVCSAGDDAVVKLWGVDEQLVGSCAHSVSVHSAAVTALALHATGEYLMSTSLDGTFALLALGEGRPAAGARAPGTAGLSSGAFHPDGLLAATGAVDGAVRIWDVKSLSNAASFEDAHGSAISGLAFSENGYHLATADSSGIVKLWDLRKLTSFRTLGEEGAGVAASVRFDDSAQFLAAGGGRGARVLSTKSWEPLCSFEPGAVVRVAFATDAQQLVVASGTGLLAFGAGA